ncbi:alpha-isopropylmalate synthase regulatory domain-containing protein, partial [Streptomyces sp. NPDC093598]|uniref:alpha-isopropylmalate synthase regulatory domain-containing protein n=1 Tax=Streptomyces sp. NPDC093598 TaxID=3366046 RepID=UPI00382952D9
AIKVDPDLYQHIDPELVGNTMRMLVSDMAGRASVELKAQELGVDLGGDRELVGRIVERVKQRERQGYAYEAADASFELLLRAEAGGEPTPYFRIESWRVIAEDLQDGTHANGATVKLWVGGRRVIATAEGNGPVNALDNALREALERFYPELAAFELVDYRVRILQGAHGTGSPARVLVTVTDDSARWSTVGVGDNVVAASWQALQDAITYGLLRLGVHPADGDRCSRPFLPLPGTALVTAS